MPRSRSALLSPVALAALLVLAVGCSAGPGEREHAPAPLSTSTGSLLAGRYAFTLTALANGKVLAAGGLGKLGPATWGSLQTAEVYDPATGAFAATGSMTVARSGHAAVRLANGKVLVAGGAAAAGTYLSSAELYDPATGTWTATGSMATSRYAHALTVLADGRVLVTGGTNAPGSAHASCEVYDPATGAWTPAAPMAHARHGHTATRFGDGGRVLAAGGLGAQEIAYWPEIYDPATGAWTATGNVPTGRYDHRAFALQDGRVIIVGGASATGARLSSVQIYQPAIDTWGTIGSLAYARSDFEGAVLGDGKVIVLGGLGGASAIAQVEVFDPATVQWTTLAPLLHARNHHGVAPLADGRFLVAGGEGYLSSAELYEPVCTPKTCAELGDQCGTASDGCGGTLSCGTCPGGQVCFANLCCTPTTCAAQGATCGWRSDGCGTTLSCGTCATGQVCTGNACCTPTTCAAQGAVCGTIPSGCGGTLSCGTCSSSEVCTGNACVPAPGAAAYDATLRVPRCLEAASACDSVGLLDGRGTKGPEANAPNTIGGSCADGTSGSYHLDESLDRLRVVAVDGGTLTAGRQARVEATVWAYSGFTSDKLDLFHAADATSPTWTLIATLTPAKAGASTLSATFTLPAGAVQAVRGSFRYGGSALPCTTGGYDDHDDLAFAVATPPDASPPTTAITAPAAGAQLSGTVTVTASAADDVGVTRVELYDGATLIGSAAAPPYAARWDTTAAANGAHVLTSRAYDAAGKSATSAPVSVTVSNLPSAIVTASYDAARRAPACAAAGTGCDSGTLLVGRGPVGPETNAPNTIAGSCPDGAGGAFHSDESLDRLTIATVDGTPLAAGKTVRVEAAVWAFSTSDRLDVYAAADAASPSWVLVATLAPAASGAQTLSTTYVLPAGATQAVRGGFRYLGAAAPCTSGSWNDTDDLVFAVR